MPGGSTGEFTTLTNAERRLLIETIVKAAAGRVPVVAGTGALGTRETVELSVHAEQAGAAAVMIIPPFYDAPSWRELQAHFARGRGRDLDPDHVLQHARRLGHRRSPPSSSRELPGVTCLKDTGGDATAAQELIQTDGPTLLNGFDTHTFNALAAGVRGGRVGRRVGHPGAVRRAAPPADRRHRPARRARAVGAHLGRVRRARERRATRPASRPVRASRASPTGPVRGPLLELEEADKVRLAAAIEHATAAQVVR